MAYWEITCRDGNDTLWVKTTSGQLTEDEIINLLVRLTCQNLTTDEIFGATLRKGDPGHNTLLDRHHSGMPISIGDLPHYTAEYKED